MICGNLNRCKSSTYNNDNQKYSFSYITEQELPKDHYKSANK